MNKKGFQHWNRGVVHPQIRCTDSKSSKKSLEFLGFFGGMWEDFEWTAPRVKRTKINVAAARWRFVTLISHLVTRCAISLVTGSLGAFFVLLSCTRFSVKGVWAFGLMRSRDRQLGQSGPRKPMRRASQRGGQNRISAWKADLAIFVPERSLTIESGDLSVNGNFFGESSGADLAPLKLPVAAEAIKSENGIFTTRPHIWVLQMRWGSKSDVTWPPYVTRGVH